MDDWFPRIKYRYCPNCLKTVKSMDICGYCGGSIRDELEEPIENYIRRLSFKILIFIIGVILIYLPISGFEFQVQEFILYLVPLVFIAATEYYLRQGSLLGTVYSRRKLFILYFLPSLVWVSLYSLWLFIRI